MDRSQFDGLIALKLVVEKKSFTSAAEAMNVSPPAVSKMIAHLESKMGITLLTRTTRSVSLTPAGSVFLEQAGPAIEQIILAQANAKSLASKPSGVLKLNMPGILYPNYLSKYIKSYLTDYPDVTVDIFSDDQATDIFELGFDAGIRVDDIIAKDLVAFKLFGPIDFVTVAAPNYLKKNGTPKHPKDLLEQNCIRHRFGTGPNIYERWEFVDGGKEISVKVSGNLILNNSESIRHAALEGNGIIYTEFGNVKKEIERGQLVLVLEKYKIQSTGYFMYYPHRSHISNTLRSFIEHFKKIRDNEKKKK
jgi:DNA-binding transcriptional LysR family regulator